MEFPHLDVSVDYKNPEDSVKVILKVIRPDWDFDKVTMKDLSTGFINKNIACTLDGHQDDGVFVRMINKDLSPQHLTTYKQLSVFLHEHSLSPKLLAVFENGICAELLQGEAITWDSRARVRDQNICRGVMRNLARFHARSVLEAADKAGIRDMQMDATSPEKLAEREKYLDGVWTKFLNDTDISTSLKAQLPAVEELNKESADLKIKIRDTEGMERAFCHLDANPSNIIVKPDGEVVIVDYDLTAISLSQVDLAGFFNCFIDIRNPDMSEYPSLEFRREALRYYLQCRRELDNGPHDVTDHDVQRLLEQMKLARLYWCYRFIMAGPFLISCREDLKSGSKDTFTRSSVMYYEEYKRLKTKYNEEKATSSR